MRRRGFLLWAALTVATATACEGRRSVPERLDSSDAAPADGGAPGRPRIVALGDSLTAGLGVSPTQAWPALVQTRLDEAGYGVEVVNAGVSGDTTAGGLRRLDWALDGDVRILVVELGANDGMRGLPVDQMQRNLDAIVAAARDRDIAVLLCGMEAPPNFGPEYTRAFREAFRDVADAHDVVFLPFFLHGVAGDVALNQADGIHPNAAGTRKVADLVWQSLEPMLARALTTS